MAPPSVYKPLEAIARKVSFACDSVASGIVLPKRVDKFYPNAHLPSGKVLPITDNQRVK